MTQDMRTHMIKQNSGAGRTGTGGGFSPPKPSVSTRPRVESLPVNLTPSDTDDGRSGLFSVASSVGRVKRMDELNRRAAVVSQRMAALLVRARRLSGLVGDV